MTFSRLDQRWALHGWQQVETKLRMGVPTASITKFPSSFLRATRIFWPSVELTLPRRIPMAQETPRTSAKAPTTNLEVVGHTGARVAVRADFFAFRPGNATSSDPLFVGAFRILRCTWEDWALVQVGVTAALSNATSTTAAIGFG